MWRYLDEIRDKEMKLHIIKEKWNVDDETAKAHATVLKMVEPAVSTKHTAFATGQMKVTPGEDHTAKVVDGQANAYATVVATYEPPRTVAATR